MRLSPVSKATTALAALALGVLAPVTAPTATAEPGTTTINLVGITDFHGHLERTTDGAGNVVDPGAVTLACEVAAARKDDPNTLFVSAGDNVGGSAYTSAILNDRPTIEALNTMGLDVSAVGNHEFDQGQADLADRILPAAAFPYLAANVTGNAALSAEGDGQGVFIKDVDGVKVGFVGVVTDELPTLVSADAVAGLTVSPALATANQRAAELKDGDPANGEADVVVVLAHEDAATQAAQFTGDVDAVFAGHTHVSFAETTTSVDGQPIAVVQADHYGWKLGRISLTLDSATGEVSVAAVENQDLTTSACTTDSLKVAPIVEDAKTEAQIAGQEVVATLGSDFLRGTYADKGVAQDPGSNRGTESTASNLLADSFAWWAANLPHAAPGRYVGIMNSGGVRADYGAGELTYGEAFTVQPFGNDMGYATYTGTQLEEILAQQWQPGSSRPVLTLGLSSNVSVYINQDAADLLEGYTKSTPAADVDAARARVIEAIYVDGAVLGEADTVIVASNSFLLKGGDSFTGFTAATATYPGVMDLAATNAYLSAVSPASASYAKRQIGIDLDVDPGTGVSTVDFTGLVFTNAAEQAALGAARSVTASVALTDGSTVEVASGDIDTSLVEAQLPETGRVTLSLTLPANAATQACTLTDPETAEAVDTQCAVVSFTVTAVDGSTRDLDVQAEIEHAPGIGPGGPTTGPDPSQPPAVVVGAPSPSAGGPSSTSSLVRTGASIGIGLLAIALLVGGGVLLSRRRSGGAGADPDSGAESSADTGADGADPTGESANDDPASGA